MMSTKCVSAFALVLPAMAASGELVRTTFSGVIDQATDLRTPGSDFLAGTDLAADLYTASIGDAWSYAIMYDSDVISGASNGSNAIYGGGISAELTVAGRSISLDDNGQWYFYFDNGLPFMEIFHDVMGGIALVTFTNPSGGSDLINGGNSPTDEGPFVPLSQRGFYFGDPSGDDFVLQSAGVNVVVEIIPAPGVLSLLLGGGMIACRRRR